MDRDVRKLSHSERAELQERAYEARTMLNDREFMHLIQDRSGIERDLRKAETMLQRDDSLVVSGSAKDRLVEENRRVSEELARHIPPVALQRVSEKDPNYEKAVKAAMHACSPEVVNLANRYKDNSMRLEPNDPNAGSLRQIVGE